MTEKQLIKVFGSIVSLLLVLLGWSFNQNFTAVKDGQADIRLDMTELKDGQKENQRDIKINFREVSGLSARLSVVEK